MAITYSTNKDNSLSKLFEQNFEAQKVQPQSLSKKILFKKQPSCDLFFQVGQVNKKYQKMMRQSKMIIASSFIEKQNLIQYGFDSSKIEVVYPFVDIKQCNKESEKNSFCTAYNIPKENTLITFASNNFQFGGAKEFLSHIVSLESNECSFVMYGSKKDIEMTHYYLKSYKQLQEKIVLIQNDAYELDKLFLACDIYVAPTKIQSFSSNVLEAMSCGCVVFVSSNNGAFEIVDTYSKMDGTSDASLAFKIDMLLKNKEELQNIQEQNKLLAQNYSKEKTLLKLKEILALNIQKC